LFKWVFGGEVGDVWMVESRLEVKMERPVVRVRVGVGG
jgi:hypothetical protein